MAKRKTKTKRINSDKHHQFIIRYAREVKPIEEWCKEFNVKSESTIYTWKKKYAKEIAEEIKKADADYIEFMNRLRGKAFERLERMLNDPDKYDKAVKYILDYAGFNEKRKIEIISDNDTFTDKEREEIRKKLIQGLNE